ncbi:hypothetical protein BJ508DRAFT_311923 [Ascobolus immersus RN42]|uniref:Uncharacterized protein n=1 Tax=Ascobolus immersus RN42 TaxID=1160509 RepID=A0A3N4HSQ2_ASCIM|nr:hypothetical protein BJ508DRAFT_311923 [Ascobolus immersus RN42]
MNKLLRLAPLFLLLSTFVLAAMREAPAPAVVQAEAPVQEDDDECKDCLYFLEPDSASPYLNLTEGSPFYRYINRFHFNKGKHWRPMKDFSSYLEMPEEIDGMRFVGCWPSKEGAGIVEGNVAYRYVTSKVDYKTMRRYDASNMRCQWILPEETEGEDE